MKVIFHIKWKVIFYIKLSLFSSKNWKYKHINYTLNKIFCQIFSLDFIGQFKYIKSMKKRYSTIIFIVIFALLDQISKYFFYDNAFLENLSFIEPSFNTGISRSLPVNLILVIILTIVISVLILIWYKKNYIWKRATIFLIWWTLGNLIDRIFLWWVRDFILVFNRFPIFNLADTFICTWAALIIIKELFLNKKK